MSQYPDQIPSSIAPAASGSTTASRSPSAAPMTAPSSSAPVYKQRAGYYAVHYANANVDPAGAEFVMAADGGGTIAVFQGEAPGKASGDRRTASPANTSQPLAEQITPVYATDNGLAAVPTGQVFVRFADGVDARDRANQLQAAGYTTVKVLDFAPQGAWVKAGSIAESLDQLQSLEGLESVEAIEPQMLMERALR